MAIPVENTPWPPKQWADAYAQYGVNDAWYTGDTDRLEKIYSKQYHDRPDYVRNGTAHKGGLIGTASRMFWGRPIEEGQDRTKFHVPAPATLATLASDLQYSDPPETTLQETDKSKQKQERLDLLLNSEETHAMFNAMGELKAALGAVVVIPRWDEEISDQVWLDYVGADCAIPIFRQGKMVEVTLWTEYVDNNIYFRHLEHHSKGRIEHALFEGTQTNLGRRVPLQTIPETAIYAEIVDSTSSYATGIDRVTAGYLKNMPTMLWRREGVLRDAGRSDFAQQLPLFDALDQAFTSWIRDLKIGQGRMVVPQEYLENLGAGQGASFDLYQEVFTPINMPGSSHELKIEPHQFEIRFEAHERTVKGIYNEILRKAGYSPASFGDMGEPVSGTTATEIQQRTEQSERTRQKKNLYDKQVLSHMASVAMELDGKIFPGKGGGTIEPPNVVFPELSRVDPRTEAETISLLQSAKFISTWQGVARANPEWNEEQIQEEVDRISQDTREGIDLIDPTLEGLPGDEDLDPVGE